MKKILLLLGVCLIICSSSCEKDDQPAIKYVTQGFIYGHISGESTDGAYTYNEDFKYTQYVRNDHHYTFYEVSDDNSIRVYIYRSNVVNGAYISISFYLDSLTSLPRDISIYLFYIKETKDSLVSLDRQNIGNNEISDFSFDPTSGRIRGSYKHTRDNGLDADMIGQFDLVVKRLVY